MAEGNRLDQETDGAWVRDGAIQVAATSAATSQVLLIDAVRKIIQIRHLRAHFGSAFVHVHVTAPRSVLEERYESRARASDTERTYSELAAEETERAVYDLAVQADVVVETHRSDPASVLARAAAGVGLFPRAPEQLVDVVVGGQYGSEGKGNICAHIANPYGMLIRVGGPNAGHLVAYPRQKYVQFPSGTGSNSRAKIVIGAGATLWVPQVLKEVDELKAFGLTDDRIFIDEQAMVIEESDRILEAESLGVIGSTKQGVGAATARKVIGRDDQPHLGAPVRLAKQHPDLSKYVKPTRQVIEDALAAGERIMLEGTQGTSLSLHHGHYPHVTSRETTASGCLADAGIAPNRVRRIVMVTRTYPIRVGGPSGYMANEIDMQMVADRSGLPLSQIQKTEIGTVSGTRRRIGEFDWEQLRRSSFLNGATDIALTFADYLDATKQNATRFEQLSYETRNIIAEIERVANAPVSLISCKFDRFGVIDRRTWQ
jgi:adenylosuccinate synthase